jgi:two-component system NarL family sensor kinase
MTAREIEDRDDRRDRLELLSAVVETLSLDLDLQEITQRVAELATGAAGSDVCFVHVLDEPRQSLVLVGATPPFDQFATKIELKLGEGIAGWVGLYGEPAVVADKWSDPRYRYIPELRGEDFSSLISVPMLRRGARVVGVLNVHSRVARHYSTDDVALVTELANLLAAGVENARLFERLAQREEALARFAARTIEAEEAERRRVAGAIHDGISQRLVSLSYYLDAAESAATVSREAAGVTAPLRAARSLVEAALAETRETIAGLRPSILDDLGLAAGLESLARSVPGPFVDVRVEVTATPSRSEPHPAHLELRVLESDVETALYRIAQEALQNVVKHAHASRVELLLELGHSRTRLVVSDDGCGLEPSLIAGSTRPGAGTRAARLPSYGLASMAERAELVGGRLEIRSEAGTGTTIEVSVPRARRQRQEELG